MTVPSKFDNWRKSSRSEPDDNCVEVAFASGRTVGVRDSKSPAGPVLEFPPHEWTSFTAALRGRL